MGKQMVQYCIRRRPRRIRRSSWRAMRYLTLRRPRGVYLPSLQHPRGPKITPASSTEQESSDCDPRAAPPMIMKTATTSGLMTEYSEASTRTTKGAPTAALLTDDEEQFFFFTSTAIPSR